MERLRSGARLGKAPPSLSASPVSVVAQRSATADEVVDLPVVQVDSSLFILTHHQTALGTRTAPAGFTCLTETSTDGYDSIAVIVY